MPYIRDFRHSYNILDSDLQNIEKISNTMLKYDKEFSNDIQKFILDKYKQSDIFNDDIVEKHSQMLELWYKKLFSGKINDDLITFIKKMVKSHSDLMIDNSTFVSIFSYIRNWIHEKIFQQIEQDVLRKDILLSVHKILDVQMSLINYFYTEIELNKYTKAFSLKNNLIQFSERFLLFTHFLLVFFLIVLTLGSIFFLGKDILHRYESHPEDIIIYTLGSLLILWVLIELLHTEIQSIKGGKFKISIFLGVALIAFVREVLILKLQHKDTGNQIYMAIAAILALGIVYFITAFVEKNDIKRRYK